ncbi:hypothetical protein CERZMDRAFT_51178 [Cercospora zeae-maydis SCOH1-5]|uniref:DUF1857-domain-containing protein n=1 Tax=Cercospora zeae-maydis SCOH1-5 TaxID=717836 RepID=A0A6A6F0G7_9PEZI|nr:hypothetical protein CERZMDRAFT_51178 [Cercospora zeae-maydis SCOH1-5]
MVTINVAYTEAINPAGTTPTLTHEQVWKGLQIKIRKAQRFVPIIVSCEVVEETENEVVRVASFKDREEIPAHEVREVCKSYYPAKVDFHQPDGAIITNTISHGAGQNGAELFMTYTFEWRHSDVDEGSEQHKALLQQHRQGAQMAVSKSLDAMRQMAADGELD